MIFNTFSKTAIAAGLALACSFYPFSSSFAAGLQLSEQSVVGMGRAFAGMGIVGDDISAISYNPAGIALTNYKAFQMDGIIINLRGDLTGDYSMTSPLGTNTKSGAANLNELRFIPSMFGVHNITPEWTVSLGMYGSYGFDLNYDKDWFGANHALTSELTAIDIHPGFAYKVNNYVSVGAGLIVELISATLTQASPLGGEVKVDADDTNIGFNVGVMVAPFEGTRLGLSYRSRIEHKITGTAELPSTLFEDAFAHFDTPDFVTFTAYQKLTDSLSVTGTARWTNWSIFKHLTIQQKTGETLSHVEENWKDSWYLSIGVDYKITPSLTTRIGFAYDSSVIDDLHYRTARIPDNIRRIVSLGLTYNHDENLSLNLAYMHVFMKDSIMDNAGGNAPLYTDRLKAEVSSSMDLFGLSLTYKF